MNEPQATTGATNSASLQQLQQGQRDRNNQLDASGPLAFPKLLQASMEQIKAALPSHITPERMLRVSLTAFRQQPLLAKCEPRSVLAAVFVAAGVGLEIGVLGHAYLLPYWNNKLRKYECQLIIGYQGYIELARRSGEIESIDCQIIFKNDHYELEFGIDRKLVHRPKLDGDRGDPVLVYSVCRYKGGGMHVEVMTWTEIMKIKARSPSKNKEGQIVGPWAHKDDALEMARKTNIRRARKYWPQSVQIAAAAANDGASFRALDVNALTKELEAQPALIETESGMLIDQETGEVLDGSVIEGEAEKVGQKPTDGVIAEKADEKKVAEQQQGGKGAGKSDKKKAAPLE